MNDRLLELRKEINDVAHEQHWPKTSAFLETLARLKPRSVRIIATENVNAAPLAAWLERSINGAWITTGSVSDSEADPGSALAYDIILAACDIACIPDGASLTAIENLAGGRIDTGTFGVVLIDTEHLTKTAEDQAIAQRIASTFYRFERGVFFFSDSSNSSEFFLASCESLLSHLSWASPELDAMRTRYAISLARSDRDAADATSAPSTVDVQQNLAKVRDELLNHGISRLADVLAQGRIAINDCEIAFSAASKVPDERPRSSFYETLIAEMHERLLKRLNEETRRAAASFAEMAEITVGRDMSFRASHADTLTDLVERGRSDIAFLFSGAGRSALKFTQPRRNGEPLTFAAAALVGGVLASYTGSPLLALPAAAAFGVGAYKIDEKVRSEQRNAAEHEAARDHVKRLLASTLSDFQDAINVSRARLRDLYATDAVIVSADTETVGFASRFDRWNELFRIASL